MAAGTHAIREKRHGRVR